MKRVAIAVFALCALTGCGPSEEPIVIEPIEHEYVPPDPKSAWHDPKDIDMPAWGRNARQTTLHDDDEIIGVNLFTTHVLKVMPLRQRPTHFICNSDR